MAVASAERTGYLTERDLEISTWVGRLLGASAEQIGRRFGLGRTQLYRRLRVLQDYGVLRRRRLIVGQPALYLVRGRRLRPASYEHALAVAELVAGRELAGARVITEQEIRRIRAHRGDLDRRLTDSDEQTILGCDRVPDMVEQVAGGGLIAYEVELSSKGRARRERVISAYAISSYEAVRWIVPARRIGQLVRANIRDYGLAGLMEVAPEASSLPGPGVEPPETGAA
jgi:DNA-binding Lrp family transcriptional regulator